MIVTLVAIYILITTGLSIWARKFIKNNQQFMTAGGQLPYTVVGVLMISEFIGSSSSMGTAQAAFTSGLAAAWAVVTYVVAFPLFGWFIAPKIHQMREYTISGVLDRQYGNSTRLVTSGIMMYALLVSNIANYVAGAAAVSLVLKVSFPVAGAITAAVTIIYVAAGGIRAVAYVNMIHFAFKFLAIAVVCGVGVSLGATYGNMTEAMPEFYFTAVGHIGLPTLIAWTIANLGAIFSTQMTIQAVASVDSIRDVRKASLISGLLSVPIGLLAAFIGVQAKFLFPDIPSVGAMPVFIQHMNPWLGAIVTIGIVATILGNVAAVSLAITALVMKDLVVPLTKPREEVQLRISRIVSFFVGLLPLPFAMMLPIIIKTMFFSKAMRTSLSMVAIMALYLPFAKSERGASAALIVTIVGASVWYFSGEPLGIDTTYIAVVLPALVLGGEHLITRGRSAGAERPV
ncbi:Na+/solute symporter [Rhodovulum sp. PH10]|uniref:sodium:solute symporter family protein n=1 Tax=Rhodovulum sp. PH10 TaxID=1187851 RepID=UPI00027C2E63|nr:sodium:solute symporter family protein [Rhodovulum sp. PH10]EJW09887.1 Na+/solute symporter [Rhodovulum sp. PH10]